MNPEGVARRATVIGSGHVAAAIAQRLREEGDIVTMVPTAEAVANLERQKSSVVVISCLDDGGPVSVEELSRLCEAAADSCDAGVDSRVAVIADARALRGFVADPNAAGLHTSVLGVIRRLARIHAATGATFNAIYAGPTHESDTVPGMVIDRIALPEEIAHAAWIAVAPFSGFMTGTLLMADGGLSLGH
jgi:NAD(P)-dependent dehydrogenase (short-subunit alcohol dehydrogenase family)